KHAVERRPRRPARPAAGREGPWRYGYASPNSCSIESLCDCSPRRSRHARGTSNTCLASAARRPTLGHEDNGTRWVRQTTPGGRTMTPSTPKPTRARGEAPADERTAGLTRRQRLVLETINEAVAARGYPPSMREIRDAVGLTSSSSVAHQLQTLERQGFLRRDPTRPRA